MVKTRLRAKLEASGEVPPPPVQEDVSGKRLEITDEASESSSQASDEKVSSSELSDEGEEEEIESKNGELGQSDDEARLPDIMTLQSSDEVAMGTSLSAGKKKMVSTSELSSCLDPGPDMAGQLYFSFDVESAVGGRGQQGLSLSVGGAGGKRDPHHELMKKSVITSDFEKREYAPVINRSRYAVQKMKKVRK